MTSLARRPLKLSNAPRRQEGERGDQRLLGEPGRLQLRQAPKDFRHAACGRLKLGHRLPMQKDDIVAPPETKTRRSPAPRQLRIIRTNCFPTISTWACVCGRSRPMYRRVDPPASSGMSISRRWPAPLRDRWGEPPIVHLSCVPRQIAARWRAHFNRSCTKRRCNWPNAHLDQLGQLVDLLVHCNTPNVIFVPRLNRLQPHTLFVDVPFEPFRKLCCLC